MDGRHHRLADKSAGAGAEARMVGRRPHREKGGTAAGAPGRQMRTEPERPARLVGECSWSPSGRLEPERRAGP